MIADLGLLGVALAPLRHLHAGSLAVALEDRLDDFNNLVGAAVVADTTHRQQVLQLGRCTLQKPKALSRLQRTCPHIELQFSTVNAAKGLEVDVVVVLDLSVGRNLIVPRSAPSPFAREIAEAGPAVRQHGESMHATERCPECGGAMVLRKGKSAFLGCTNFPLCRGTRRAPQLL